MQKFEYKHLLPANFNQDSRVWIYQSNRLFPMAEALQIEELLESFTNTWTSHGDTVKGHANLLFGQFILLIADETATGVSGCSTDSSVRLIKEIEKNFQVEMFNRQLLAFLVKDKVQLLPISQLSYAMENEFISSETIYFNNVVQNLAELKIKWMVPVKDSWLATKIAARLNAGSQ
ncbi:MAG: hypothetical protein WKF89_14430 [Chitinophagaceae bacterium]